MSTKKNQDIAVWWVDKMMHKFVGVATQIFIPAHRYYHTISECKHEYHDELFPAMPPSCEAFGVLVYENCWSKWKHVYALEHSTELNGKKVRTFAKDVPMSLYPHNHFLVRVDQLCLPEVKHLCCIPVILSLFCYSPIPLALIGT